MNKPAAVIREHRVALDNGRQFNHPEFIPLPSVPICPCGDIHAAREALATAAALPPEYVRGRWVARARYAQVTAAAFNDAAQFFVTRPGGSLWHVE